MQFAKVLAAGAGFELADDFFVAHQPVCSGDVFAQESRDRQVQAVQQGQVQALDMLHLKGREMFATAGPANRQLRQIAEDVACMLQVDHEHEDFLGAISVIVAQAFLAYVRQIGANRRA